MRINFSGKYHSTIRVKSQFHMIFSCLLSCMFLLAISCVNHWWLRCVIADRPIVSLTSMMTSWHGNIGRITCFCEGDPTVTHDFSQWASSAKRTLLLAWTNCWIINWGELRYHDAQVISLLCPTNIPWLVKGIQYIIPEGMHLMKTRGNALNRITADDVFKCSSWLGAGAATSHYLNQWCLVYWRIYPSLGLNKLTQFMNEYMWKQVDKSIYRRTPDILRLTYISMTVTDNLASHKPQATSNHYAYSTGTGVSWNILHKCAYHDTNIK